MVLHAAHVHSTGHVSHSPIVLLKLQVSAAKDDYSRILQHDHNRDHDQSDITSQFAGSKSRGASHPRFSYTCFLCGRDFGSRSLGMHISQCLHKWEISEALLPLDEQRNQPTIPKELADPAHPTKLLSFKDGAAEGILPTQPKEVDNFNRAMSELARKNWQVGTPSLIGEHGPLHGCHWC